VYRLGWYRGDGGRSVYEGRPAAGIPREPPELDPKTGLGRCAWPVTDSLFVTEDWTPGQYVAKLDLTTGPHAGTAALVPFVVRRPPDRPASSSAGACAAAPFFCGNRIILNEDQWYGAVLCANCYEKLVTELDHAGEF